MVERISSMAIACTTNFCFVIITMRTIRERSVFIFYIHCRYSFKKQGIEGFWALAQSGRVMETVIPCQGGQKELSDIMLTTERYFMLKTQTRERKLKVIYHWLSSQLIWQVNRLEGFEPSTDAFMWCNTARIIRLFF